MILPWKEKKGIICQKMIRNEVPYLVKLEIQLLGEKIWNQKLSQRTLKSILRHFQALSITILSSDQSKAQNSPHFITLSQISEQEKIEIIQKGFQLQSEGRISLKKYYEGTDPSSLFQSKGYSIKYETIRRTKLYQSLKE